MAKNTSLSSVLKELKRKGCYPCVSYRGDGIWRAHINGAEDYCVQYIRKSEKQKPQDNNS